MLFFICALLGLDESTFIAEGEPQPPRAGLARREATLSDGTYGDTDETAPPPGDELSKHAGRTSLGNSFYARLLCSAARVAARNMLLNLDPACYRARIASDIPRITSLGTPSPLAPAS